MLIIGEKAKNTLNWIIGLSVITFSLVGMFYLGWQLRVLDYGLVVSEESLDFGEVWESNAFHWSFPIENLTKNEVSIRRLATSCSCVSVSPQSMTLKAGEKADVHLTLDLTRKPSESNLTIRTFEAHIVPLLEKGIAHQRGWSIRGKVKSAVSLSSQYYNLGDVLANGKPSVKEVIVTAHTPLREISITNKPKNLSAKITERKDNTFLLQIAVSSELKIGPFSGEVRLLPIATEGRDFPEVVLPVEGVIVEDIQALPSTIVFGDQVVNNKMKATIVLNSREQVAFEIVGIDSPSGVLIQPIPKTTLPNSSKAFRIVQTISHKGSVFDTIVFKVRNQKGRLFKLPIPVSYYGRDE